MVLQKALIDRSHLERLSVSILLTLYPILLLSVRNGMSVCQIALMAVSIAALYLEKPKINLDGLDWVFLASLASLLAATFISDWHHGALRLGAFDGPSRFLFAVPIYLGLRRLPASVFRPLEYSLPLGVVSGFLATVFLSGPHFVFYGTYFLDSPMWGGSMLALSFLAVCSINWFGRDTRLLLALKIGAFALGIFSIIETDERGTWVAAAIAGLAIVFLRLRSFYRFAAVALGVAVAATAYVSIPTVSGRVSLTATEISKAWRGDLDTSIGKRLQIWRAAAMEVRSHPVVGVGSEGVASEFRELDEAGWFTSGGLKAALSQIHNEIIANTLRLGALGFISILSLYFVPLVLFLLAFRAPDQTRRIAGLCGAVFVLTYVILGCSNEIFNLKMLAGFYATTVAVLMAVARPDGNARLSDSGIGHKPEALRRSARVYSPST